jgi:peptide/nickel transport system permease protein
MLRYLSYRLLYLGAVLLGISLLVFVAISYVPGDLATVFLGRNASESAVIQFRERFGLDQPLIVRYLQWLAGALHGSFGQSFTSGVDVGPEILKRLPVTLELTLFATLISVAIGIPAGVAAALRHGGKIDTIVSVSALAGLSIPSFVLATVFVFVFAVFLRILPSGGYVPLLENPARNVQFMIMPCLALGIVSSGVVMRMTRASMIEVLQFDYIMVARAKGTGGAALVLRHALKNALMPVVAVLGLEITAFFGGAILIEQIFNLPGVASLALRGISQRDYPVVQASVLVIAAFVVVVSFATDLFFAYLDPRRRG